MSMVDMRRADFLRVLLVDQLGNIAGELPAASVKEVNWGLMSLGGVPQASLDFNGYDSSLTSVLLGQQEVQIRFTDVIGADGQPKVWWGMMGGDSSEPGKYALDLESIEGWLGCRCIETATLTYGGDTCQAPMEQFDIGWDLVNQAQTGTDMALNFTSAYTPSGVTRCRVYQRDQHQFYLDLLIEFTTLQNGFDWEIVPHADGRRVWTPYYPQKGVHRLDIRFLYDTARRYATNLSSFKRTRDLKQMATRAYATGGSDGAIKFEQSYNDVASGHTYGPRVAIVSDGSQMDLTWLANKAQQTVTQRNHPVVTLEVTAPNHLPANPDTGIVPPPLLSLVSTGDWYWVTINDGATQENAEYRLGTIKWNSDDTLTLGFIVPVTR